MKNNTTTQRVLDAINGHQGVSQDEILRIVNNDGRGVKLTERNLRHCMSNLVGAKYNRVARRVKGTKRYIAVDRTAQQEMNDAERNVLMLYRKVPDVFDDALYLADRCVANAKRITEIKDEIAQNEARNETLIAELDTLV